MDQALHVGIIMDGNGRWARARCLPRHLGHREGAKAVRAVVERAADPSAGIGCLTLYAFSSDNWERPRDEVRRLMTLFREYLRREVSRCLENGVRMRVIGRRDRLSPALRTAVGRAETATAACAGLTLRLAVDYSARDTILRAAARAMEKPMSGGALDRTTFGAFIGAAQGDGVPTRDVDLLIRTGGEQRLSDFLLWECAYAELLFTPTLWPDFSTHHLDDALAAFRQRERRFGQVAETLHAAVAT